VAEKDNQSGGQQAKPASEGASKPTTMRQIVFDHKSTGGMAFDQKSNRGTALNHDTGSARVKEKPTLKPEKK